MSAKFSVIIGVLALVYSPAFSQKDISSADSIRLVDKMVFKNSISKENFKYPLPVILAGYRIKLIGSDNCSVINKSGNVFEPLNDATVNLLFRVTQLKDSASMEIGYAVSVKGKYNNGGLNPKPFVIPALREWYGGTGNFKLTIKSRIVVDKKYSVSLMKAAKMFKHDLEDFNKISPRIIVGLPKTGDIFITLGANKSELGDEGYLLSINDFITINAANYTGAFWGTRTVLQMLAQNTDHLHLPKGISRDYPKYEVRGFMLDLGRKYFKIGYLRDYVKLMSYYKMNNFQLHLNDNNSLAYFNNNWDSTYSGFRLESKTYPQLPTKGEYYSKQEFINLQILAEDYAVRIIPEIDVPAHSLAFSKAFPQIASKDYGKDHLDLKSPETYSILENVFKEYLEGNNPVFRDKEVHIGTDEYNKKESEAFRKFTDHFIKHVQSFGKDVRIWGALTHAQGITPVTSKGVTMNAWYNGYAEPLTMKKLGYPLISTPDGALYIVPAAGYYHDYLDLKYLYKTWEPVMIGKTTFKMGDPFIRGGMFCVWNDAARSAFTAQDITDRVFPAMQVLSQKMWTGTDTTINYAQFIANAAQVNEAPGINLRGKIMSTDSLVINYNMKGFDKSMDLHNADYVLNLNRKVLDVKSKNSYVNLPYNEIGYNYTVSFSINPSASNAANAIIFQSDNAVVKLNQGNTTHLGFSHEKTDYDFGVTLPQNVWSNIVITGDNNSTTLYRDGELVKKLTRIRIPKGNNKDSTWLMQTLFFPLKKIGDNGNSFVGLLKNLKVFNQVLTATQILAMKKEDDNH